MKNNILLVYGGNSVEHEISVISALQILNSYKGKYNLIPCYLKNGIFYYSKKLVNLSFYKNINQNLKKTLKVNFKANNNYIKVGFKKIPFLAVWLVVHGKYCEDGTLYSYFKTLNIDVIAEETISALIGQNKVLSKKLCQVTTLPYYEITNYEFNYKIKEILEKAEELKYPLIIKPIDLGSSVGIYEIYNNEELIDKIQELIHLSNSIIIEKKLENFDELNIAAFMYKKELHLSKIEKVSHNKVLSYNDKYVNNEKSMIGQNKELPAQISLELENQIKDMAQKIYVNLKANYIVRMDFLYDNQNDIIYFNEINNIPGSLATYLFDIPKNELIDMYINEGLKNIDNQKEIITTYQDNIFRYNSLNNVKLNK